MDEDLFDVFDSESSKSKQIVIPSSGEEIEETKVDPKNLVQEICGAKRSADRDVVTDEGTESKKIKTDAETTIMTGMSDLEVKQKIESDEKQVNQFIEDPEEPEKLEEDETVISLVESAPR